MMEEFLESINASLTQNGVGLDEYSPLVLAYIGDAVYELYIRTLLVSEGKSTVHKLHSKAVDYVKAKAQSDILHRITDQLTPDEQDIVRRGRNAKSGTIPKNANVNEYKHATGFETLLGYLYIKKDYRRLLKLLELAAGNARQERPEV
jgi:ribonuclease-3 family protein